MANRPAIPAELQRKVLVEAGHRCAILRCRHETTEIAHIVPWSKVKKHTFDNLIALCPNCHTRYDKGEIDRKAMMIYKANLTLVTSRYGDLERRVLEEFAKDPNVNTIKLPGVFDILMRYLIDDGLLVRGPEITQGQQIAFNMKVWQNYTLTPKGRDFVNKWVSAKELT
jgi:hypothetical protein